MKWIVLGPSAGLEGKEKDTEKGAMNNDKIIDDAFCSKVANEKKLDVNCDLLLATVASRSETDDDR